MAQARINVGPLDARARQVAGVFAIVGGLTALDGFFQALGFLTWIVCAAMMYVGILFAMGGFKDGTGEGRFRASSSIVVRCSSFTMSSRCGCTASAAGSVSRAKLWSARSATA